MTREEQIRGALNLYAPSSWNFIGEITPMSKDELQASHEGFIRGAKWADANPKQGLVALSQVWHNAKEEPQTGRKVVAINEKGISFSGVYWPYNAKGYVPKYPGVYWIGGGCMDGARLLDWQEAVKWAYIDDLLPKEGL